jgi:hypothetical protein
MNESQPLDSLERTTTLRMMRGAMSSGRMPWGMSVDWELMPTQRCTQPLRKRLVTSFTCTFRTVPRPSCSLLSRQ